MAKGYWIVHVEVANLAAYKTYREFVEPFLAANKGHFLVRGGQQSVPECNVRSRTVVVEFPSLADAERAYHSSEYENGKKLRTEISAADFAIVEGYEG